MYTADAANARRGRFASDHLETASPARIVVLCFDRLDRDLALALAAMGRGDHYETNEALGHAQDLITELVGMLDLDRWEHGGSLVALYDYLLRLLAAANATKHADAVAEAQHIVAELGEGFRAAAADPVAPEPESISTTGGFSVKA